VDSLTIERMRRVLAPAALVLLALVGLLIAGLACACGSVRPGQTVDRALTAAQANPLTVDVWTGLERAQLVGLVVVALVGVMRMRPSPSLLGRLLL
jgi:voltage-gated potassium channel Kch